MKGSWNMMAMPLRRFLLHPSAFILVFLSGCAHCEYDVVQPPDLAGHVGETSWVALRRDNDLEYRLRSAEDRLVMRVYNRGERPVKLLGEDSAAVDPRGESHPLQSATIPPGAFVTRIFPPPLPRARRYGPSFGFGVGAGYVGRTRYRAGAVRAGRGRANAYRPHRHRHAFHSAGFHDFEPRYYTVYDPNDRTYFAWPGETAVRFIFAFQPDGGDVFRQEFLIRRRRM